MQLEDLQVNAAVRGILADALVTVVSVQWFGAEALELTYKTPGGALVNELLYRHDEARLEIARPAVELRRRWRALPSGVRGPAHPSCASVRPAARGAHLAGRAAAAPDHRCV